MDNKTGVVIPLAALYTKECPAAGDFVALKSFADFCVKCNLNVIQLLPVNDTGTHSSPYSGLSAFALHPLYIRINAIPEFDDAMKNDKAFAAAYNSFIKNIPYKKRFNYDEVLNKKNELLHLLYSYIEKKIAASEKAASKSGSKSKTKVVTVSSQQTYADIFKAELDSFVKDNSWVISYAVFKNLKDTAMQASWKTWSEELQHLTRKQINLRWSNKALKSSHNFFVWCQLRAHEQFKDAADYVREKGITLKGDIPILMNEDSADTWGWPEFFNHDLRAGSPPDGENPMGQNWGFPTYRWDNLSVDGYTWWTDRVKVAADYYDAFRIDHILGFFRIWAVNNRDTNAYLGHTVPCRSITRQELYSLGFDEGRLHWMSEPHVPTSLIEDITWNHDEAAAVLSKVCDRLGNEELWNFKKEIKGDKDIFEQHFCDDGDKDNRIKQALSAKWRDRTLVEISPDNFVKVWTYSSSTAWKTLNGDEQSKLNNLFARCADEEDQLWKKQALETLGTITKATRMTACAEDLGCSLKVMDEVLQELSILSLKVVRWNRLWNQNGQPYVDYKNYPKLSVVTTSVHDCPTLRQWWQCEKQSVQQFLNQFGENGISADREFNPDIAKFCLESSARANGAWYINPLQDYLFLDQKYYLDNPDDERINVPGTVNEFNWTYRIPVSIEELSNNEKLIEQIKEIAAVHQNS